MFEEDPDPEADDLGDGDEPSEGSGGPEEQVAQGARGLRAVAGDESGDPSEAEPPTTTFQMMARDWISTIPIRTSHRIVASGPSLHPLSVRRGTGRAPFNNLAPPGGRGVPGSHSTHPPPPP